MTDEQASAQTKIDQLIKESHEKIRQAMEIADQHGLEFSYEPEHLGTYYGKGNTDFHGDPDAPLGEGEWYPSSWSSSSIYC